MEEKTGELYPQMKKINADENQVFILSVFIFFICG